jgi:outer membrane lipase/esterase
VLNLRCSAHIFVHAQEFIMPRISHLAAACALALCAQAAQAQQFSGVVTFGDSLSDAGNTSTVDGNAATFAGNSFTTNNDPVHTQIIAAFYGFNQVHSFIGGSNYAFGGSCAQAAGACVAPTLPRLNVQIGQYLTPRTGAADRNALFTVFSGANDIFAAIGGGVWTTSAAISAGSAGVAGAVITNVNTLQTAGANYIVVYNLPDLGRTPQFGASTATSAPFNLATVSYNAALSAGLTGRNGIIPVNTFALVNEVIANPSLYGFTNVTGIACGPGAPGVVSSAACGAVGSGNPFSYAAGTNNTFLFADGVHPTGAGHRLLASVVLSTLAAPGKVSIAAELPISVYDDHSNALSHARLDNMVVGTEVGTSNGYFNAQFGARNYNSSVNTASVDVDTHTFSGGFDYRYSEGLSFGAAASYGGAGAKDNGLGLDGKEFLGSVFATGHFGNGYVSGAVSLGSSKIDISRDIVLGPTVRTETGNATASHKAFELSGGYLFGDAVRHGPFASVTWQKIGVGDYAENSGNSTAMRFDSFDRKSLVGRLGYQLQGEFGGERSVRPSLRVAYAAENKDQATRVTAGSTSMGGQFTLPGFTPSNSWIEADLALSMKLTDSIDGSVGYQARFSDDSQSNKSLNIGVNVKF